MNLLPVNRQERSSDASEVRRSAISVFDKLYQAVINVNTVLPEEPQSPTVAEPQNVQSAPEAIATSQPEVIEHQGELAVTGVVATDPTANIDVEDRAGRTEAARDAVKDAYPANVVPLERVSTPKDNELKPAA